MDSKDKEKMESVIKAFDIIMRDYFPMCSYSREIVEKN